MQAVACCYRGAGTALQTCNSSRMSQEVPCRGCRGCREGLQGGAGVAGVQAAPPPLQRGALGRPARQILPYMIGHDTRANRPRPAPEPPRPARPAPRPVGGPSRRTRRRETRVQMRPPAPAPGRLINSLPARKGFDRGHGIKGLPGSEIMDRIRDSPLGTGHMRMPRHSSLA